MNEVIEKEINIENIIYEIREKQVMLDSDIAKLYGVETKRINEALYRNKAKFPERFCFKLTNEESKSFLVAIFDQKNKLETRGGKYKNPTVFTEQGVYMLATILKSKTATEVTLKIMDTFVSMKQFIIQNKNIFLHQINIQNDITNINNKLIEHDKKFGEIFDKFNTKEFKEQNNHIFYEGQIYDAYDLMMRILSKAKTEIIIIDNYAGRELLNLIREIKVSIKIYSSNINTESVKKYKEQYSNVEIIHNNKFHDRFIILDKKELYHSGSSFKDLGKKCFAINKIKDKKYMKGIIEEINE